MMRTPIITVLLALGLAGCATTSQYGNFAPPHANQQKLATDAVQPLVMLYPPAKTRFELRHATPDAFGLALVNALRERGYAVMEYEQAAKEQTLVAGTPAALPLRYVFDQDNTTGMYRLTMLIGNQSITRPYLEKEGALVPAGYWVRKE